MGVMKLRTALAATGMAAAMMMVAPIARAGDGLTREQNWALLYASMIGSSYYAALLPKTYDFPHTLTAVLTQESSLCSHKKGMDKTSYGCGQVKSHTAQLMYGAPVTVKKLQKDDALNIRIAARYLAYCMQQMPSWERGVICYNAGPHLAKTISADKVAKNAYLNKIRRRMREAQSLLASVD
jgi:transglycosylase-like protein with SLT domain